VQAVPIASRIAAGGTRHGLNRVGEADERAALGRTRDGARNDVVEGEAEGPFLLAHLLDEADIAEPPDSCIKAPAA
jgi:hypothetical protein